MSMEHRTDDRLGVEALVQELMHPVQKSHAAASRPPHSPTATTRRHNRRHTERVSLVATDVVVTIEHENVSVVDLSVGGIQFRTNRRVVPGATVMLNVHWRDNGRTSLALGRVIWAIYEKPARFSYPHYRVGALFEQSDLALLRTVVQRYGLTGTGPDVEVVDQRA